MERIWWDASDDILRESQNRVLVVVVVVVMMAVVLNASEGWRGRGQGDRGQGGDLQLPIRLYLSPENTSRLIDHNLLCYPLAPGDYILFYSVKISQAKIFEHFELSGLFAQV